MALWLIQSVLLFAADSTDATHAALKSEDYGILPGLSGKWKTAESRHHESFQSLVIWPHAYA